MQVEKTQQGKSVGFRLSPQQEYVWLLGPDSDAARAQCCLVVRGIEPSALQSALHAVVQRHEALRTTFVPQPGLRFPAQVIHDSLDPLWEVRSVADVSLQGDALADLLAGEAQHRFDLAGGPLVRALLLSPAGGASLLLLTTSALCSDTTSLRVIAAELAASAEQNARSTVEPLQYADFAEWRNELLAGDDEDASAARAFWANIHGAPPSPRLLFRSADARSGLAPGRQELSLDPDVVAAVEGARRELGVSMPLFLEACWHALVARLSGETDLALGGVVDGRAHEELRGAVGAFEQAVPVQTRIDEETTFAEVLDQVTRSRGENQRRQDFVASADLQRFAERQRLVFSAVDDTEAVVRDPAMLETRIVAGPLQGLLELRWHREGGWWTGELVYETGGYSRDDVARVASSFEVLLAAAAEDPSARVGDLRLLPAAERERLIHAADGEVVSIPEASVHELFEQQVDRVPGQAAVSDGTYELTYAELDARASQVAHFLRSRGVGRDVAVGLCMDRSAEMIVALLGILKAGGAYLPLNFEHPPARLAHQLREADAPLLISQERLLDQLTEFGGEVLCLDRDRALVEACPSSRPDPVTEPGDRVYVMYTSGSTGLPKGVEVTHRNVVNYASDIIGRLGSDAGEAMRFGVVSAISTDLGNTCVFAALLSGGCLHLVQPETAMDGARLADALELQPFDVLKITPSHLRALLATSVGRPILPRRWLIVGGEALSWDLLDEISTRGRCNVLNHYGPTETTVGACTFDTASDVAEWQPGTVPIGRPIANTRVYIVDDGLEPVPVGVAGELCIAGAGVARGYVGQPDQTNEVFVADPFGPDEHARLYRTGDRARFLPDGNIEFLGRIDSQVKIRGYRVEPSEIERSLERHPAVRQAAVVARDDGAGDPRLVAYVVGSSEVGADELRAFLRETLPDFMVPSSVVALDALPFTSSGKVDRRALPDPAVAETREYVAPRTPLEEALASIWAEVLRVDRVGVTDDFFALGGHSLLATQVVARVRSDYVDIPLHSIFTAPTVEQLAEVVLETELERMVEDDLAVDDDGGGARA
ncbi:MAG TPA: amino acid adenylation domain-containing protein [Gaiellaceae bacterium]